MYSSHSSAVNRREKTTILDLEMNIIASFAVSSIANNRHNQNNQQYILRNPVNHVVVCFAAGTMCKPYKKQWDRLPSSLLPDTFEMIDSRRLIVNWPNEVLQ